MAGRISPEPKPNSIPDGTDLGSAATFVGNRLLHLPEVMARVGMKRSAIYQRISEGKFPKSRSLGPKCAVWVEAEINAWIASIAVS